MAIERAELDPTVVIEKTTGPGAVNVESVPPLTRVQFEGFGCGGRVPSIEQVLGVADAERAESRPHQLFRCRSRARTAKKRSTAGVESFAAQTWAQTAPAQGAVLHQTGFERRTVAKKAAAKKNSPAKVLFIVTCCRCDRMTFSTRDASEV